LLSYYNGSHIKALMKLYPELVENFLQFKEGWKSLRNQRKFFDAFARSKKFNPSDAENWYSVTYKEIISAGGSTLLGYYNGSHIKALVKLYPELKLKKGNFLNSKKGWKSLGNQRKFFDDFARSKNFNPLDSGNWYFITCKDVRRAGGNGLLKYYNGSHVRALVKLYPELMLRKESFFQFKGFVKHSKYTISYTYDLISLQYTFITFFPQHGYVFSSIPESFLKFLQSPIFLS